MTLNLSVDEVLTTTRSVRKRLDLEKPVSREVLLECLDLAIQAPTGSNAQGWQWVFVEEADKKKALADIYRKRRRVVSDDRQGPNTPTATSVVSGWMPSPTRRSTSPSTWTRYRC